MAIYNPGKYYLLSVDETEDICCISPFDLERVEQKFGDVISFTNDKIFNPDYITPIVTKIEGQLYGTMRILKTTHKIDNITAEEILDLIKEQNNE